MDSNAEPGTNTGTAYGLMIGAMPISATHVDQLFNGTIGQVTVYDFAVTTIDNIEKLFWGKTGVYEFKGNTSYNNALHLGEVSLQYNGVDKDTVGEFATNISQGSANNLIDNDSNTKYVSNADANYGQIAVNRNYWETTFNRGTNDFENYNVILTSESVVDTDVPVQIEVIDLIDEIANDYKIKVIGSGSNSYVIIAEIKLQNINNGQYITLTNPTASSIFQAANSADKAIDGNLGTAWHSSSGNGNGSSMENIWWKADVTLDSNALYRIYVTGREHENNESSPVIVQLLRGSDEKLVRQSPILNHYIYGVDSQETAEWDFIPPNTEKVLYNSISTSDTYLPSKAILVPKNQNSINHQFKLAFDETKEYIIKVEGLYEDTSIRGGSLYITNGYTEWDPDTPRQNVLAHMSINGQTSGDHTHLWFENEKMTFLPPEFIYQDTADPLSASEMNEQTSSYLNGSSYTTKNFAFECSAKLFIIGLADKPIDQWADKSSTNWLKNTINGTINNVKCFGVSTHDGTNMHTFADGSFVNHGTTRGNWINNRYIRLKVNDSSTLQIRIQGDAGVLGGDTIELTNDTGLTYMYPFIYMSSSGIFRNLGGLWESGVVPIQGKKQMRLITHHTDLELNIVPAAQSSIWPAHSSFDNGSFIKITIEQPAGNTIYSSA